MRARWFCGGLVLSLAITMASVAPALARSNVVRAGAARFEVVTPTLIRLQYAQDGGFAAGRTMTTGGELRLPTPAFTVTRSGGWLLIRTRAVALRYRLGSGPFSASNLALRLGASRALVHPTAGSGPGNLGGWRRALDLLQGPVPLADGLLSRAGWYVLDDTATALLTPGQPPGFTARPAHTGAYQDWYLFAYGSDLAGALRDLRALSGPAPLLPRTAFGVWFSRYWPYSESDYHDLLAQFRANRVPLDTLSVDTDWKRESSPEGAAVAAIVAGAPGKPYSWDGWEWDPALFPDPPGFLSWAHSQGLSVTLNIHPSISTNDPQWAATNTAAGGLSTSSGECRILLADPTAQCGVFDWTNPRQLDAYFALHRALEQDGVDFFWLDWCCDDSSASAPGLTADTWINSLYAAQERARGLRWLAFSRAGASYNGDSVDGDDQSGGTGIFAEHRYTIQFTGDTCATWPMLAFEAQFSAEEGNVGLPYVSDDIGSFNGQPEAGQCSAETGLAGEHLPDDLYARWVAFGTFQPLDRLHSNHGDRLPWEYGAAADAAAASFLRLRDALIPYTYTADRDTYDSGLPLTGALYLRWPGSPGAYQHPSEYTFGPDMVVAPVTADGDPAPATLWIPPGQWVDYFTGERFRGPAVVQRSVGLSQMPVLVPAGAVIPTQPYAPFTAPGPPRSLILTAYPGPRGSFKLYDDAGLGFGYASHAYAWTTIVQTRSRARTAIVIGPARGRYAGAPRTRSWQVQVLAVRRPRTVRVRQGGQRVRARWSYASSTRVLTVTTPAVSTRRALAITAR